MADFVRWLRSMFRAVAAEPAFHFKDRIVVSRGFFKGQRGEVRELNGYQHPGQYMVLLDGETYGKHFYEHELEREAPNG